MRTRVRREWRTKLRRGQLKIKSAGALNVAASELTATKLNRHSYFNCKYSHIFIFRLCLMFRMNNLQYFLLLQWRMMHCTFSAAATGLLGTNRIRSW